MGSKHRIDLEVIPGECWWGGATVCGHEMPFADGFLWDLQSLGGNNAMPLLISSEGRYVWSERPFSIAMAGGRLVVETSVEDGTISLGEGFGDLPGAYHHAASRFFPSTGEKPKSGFFTAPQYNTWIEMTYFSTQARVLDYAQKLLASGFPPGVLMIDTLWHETYGNWTFHSGRFPDPKRMADQLHDKGFKLMLWVCPYVTPDTVTFRSLRDKGLLVQTPDGEPAIGRWWDGYGASLDLINPQAIDWLWSQLDHLVGEIGVDGFKLDGGQPVFWEKMGVERPHDYTTAWNRVGLRYEYAEYKDSWKCAGWPLVQRVRDRYHSWDREHGLGSLIPMGLAQGLIGYSFVCPDMIGGGEYQDFPTEGGGRLDPELFVRYAQCAALFPMMQFSAAPWRLLDAEHLGYCVAAARLHSEMGDEIVALADRCAVTGEPMMRHLAYAYPKCGYEHTIDQFLLGEEILVAPVLEKGATQRKVVFPPGTWCGDDGSVVDGPAECLVDAPLARLPWYRRLSG